MVMVGEQVMCPHFVRGQNDVTALNDVPRGLVHHWGGRWGTQLGIVIRDFIGLMPHLTFHAVEHLPFVTDGPADVLRP